MLRKLKVKAESFETWITKVRDVLDPATPTLMTLEDLQMLAQEAEDKKFPSSVLLERLNSAVLEAEKCVTVIQQLDINKVRTRTRNSTCEIAKYKLTIDELDMFVQEINNLCCIIPEGNSVKELQAMGKEFCEVANYILSQPLDTIKMNSVEKQIEDGSLLCIELPQMKPLKAVLNKIRWYTAVTDIRDTEEKIPMHTIKKMLKEGHDLQVVDGVDDTLIQHELHRLQSIMIDVEEWEAEAKKCFESGTQHEIPEIEELLLRADTIDGKLQSQGILEDALKKAKEWLATVEILQANEHYPYFHTLENVVNRGKNIPFQLEELKRMEEYLVSARSWKHKTSRTFLKRSSVLELMEVLSPRARPIMYCNVRDHKNGTMAYRDDQLCQQFSEDMGPAQMVVTFKNAEEKEMREMLELRDNNAKKNPECEAYCVCHQEFYGVMYHCHLCRDWFHAGCIRNTPCSIAAAAQSAAAGAAASNSANPIVPQLSGRNRDCEIKYLCESCQRSKRPRLETILTLLVSLQKLPIRLPEGEALQCLTERAMNWQDRARQILGNDEIATALASMQKHTDVDQLKSTEHTYSATGNDKLSQSASTTALATSSGATVDLAKHAPPAPPLVALEDDTMKKLDELMMEGDLLEVSLDETQYLWRLYNATKPDISDLDQVNSLYKIKVSVVVAANCVITTSENNK